MGFFGQAKDLYSMQKQAKAIKAQLKNIHIEAEIEGMVVTVDGEQKLIEVKIPEAMMQNAVKMAKTFVDAANKAIKKSQEIAAEKMKPVMNAMGGLMGNK